MVEGAQLEIVYTPKGPSFIEQSAKIILDNFKERHRLLKGLIQDGYAGIAMKLGHIVGKATFVNVHKGPCFLLIGTNLLLERLPELRVCLRMAEEFFYGSVQDVRERTEPR